MLVELTELIGRQVYTNDARLLGEVSNLVVDVENARVDGIFISETNQLLVEDSMSVNVPFRWVGAINDVLLLKYFPKRVSMKKTPAQPPASSPPPQGRGSAPARG
jgi:sporulation protein YlmC with PRC-barrel domain